MKNILLIGGSYGIGSSLAQILAENNQVIIASRSKPENDLKNVKHITFDASNDEIDLNQLPETIDGFVYFPGSINLRPFKGLSIDSFKQDLEINVISLIKVLKSILPKLNTSDNPSLVFLSTVAVSQGMPFHSSVATAKGAIRNYIFYWIRWISLFDGLDWWICFARFDRFSKYDLPEELFL